MEMGNRYFKPGVFIVEPKLVNIEEKKVIKM